MGEQPLDPDEMVEDVDYTVDGGTCIAGISVAELEQRIAAAERRGRVAALSRLAQQVADQSADGFTRSLVLELIRSERADREEAP